MEIFKFENDTIRMAGTYENILFVAQDICKALGIKDPSKALKDFEEGYDKTTVVVETQGGSQRMLVVTEPGIYRLIFQSRKQKAKKFQKWVFQEVLPKIRKTGSYIHHTTQESQLQLDFLNNVRTSLSDLHQLNNRDRIIIADGIRNLGMKQISSSQSTNSTRDWWSISDYCVHKHKLQATKQQLIRIGKTAAKLYERKHGKKPSKHEQFVDGASRLVNSYSTDDESLLLEAFQNCI